MTDYSLKICVQSHSLNSVTPFDDFHLQIIPQYFGSQFSSCLELRLFSVEAGGET